MFKSINPYTSITLKKYALTTKQEVDVILFKSKEVHLNWENQSISNRSQQIRNVGTLLYKNLEIAAQLVTQEIGKPITQSRAEIEKCIALCNFYAEKASVFLEKKQEKGEIESYVSYEPLGVILGIMPWNYPFWQVFRFAIPTLISGNSVLVKHASNVGGCALYIEAIFKEAINLPNVYQNIFLDNSATQNLISNNLIKGISLTGSTQAGRSVAREAGKYLKPVVLELGGSNALIVCKDAHLDKAVKACVVGRFQNNGQSCIAVKRVLVDKSIEKEFTKMLIVAVQELKIGNPLDSNTYISVLSRPEFIAPLAKKIETSIKEGASLIYGGNYKAAYFEPTIVTNVTSKMPLFKQETFGPILPITSFLSIAEAIELANATDYGLGVSIFTEDVKAIKEIIPKFKDGAVFINNIVKSIPQLPFGGTKTSGLGRELGEEGIKAFVNIKTVVIK